MEVKTKNPEVYLIVHIKILVFIECFPPNFIVSGELLDLQIFTETGVKGLPNFQSQT